MTQDELLDAKSTARVLGVATRTVLRMFRDGKIRAVQLDGIGGPKLWRTTRQDIQEYLDDLSKSRVAQS